jgi:hypothetical protein
VPVGTHSIPFQKLLDTTHFVQHSLVLRTLNFLTCKQAVIFETWAAA